MNRKQRKAIEAQGGKDAVIDQLTKENRALKQDNQMLNELLRQAKAAGHIEVTIDNRMKPGSLAVPYETVQQMTEDAFFDGLEQSEKVFKAWLAKLSNVFMAARGIYYLSMANGGAATVEAMTKASAEIMAALDELDSFIRQVERWKVIAVNYELMAEISTAAQELHRLAKRYIEADDKTRAAAQQALQAHISVFDRDMLELLYRRPSLSAGRPVASYRAWLADQGRAQGAAGRISYAKAAMRITAELYNRQDELNAVEGEALQALGESKNPGDLLRRAMQDYPGRN